MNRRTLATLCVTAVALSAIAAAERNDSNHNDENRVDSCGYPHGKAPALSSVRFDSGGAVHAFKADPATGKITAWYTSEHALPLGVRRVVVKTKSGATATDYATVFTPFDSLTLSAVSPASPLPVGTTAITGAQAGTDNAVWNHE